MQKPEPKEALNRSDAVFAGKVESITEVSLKLEETSLKLDGATFSTSTWKKVVFRVSESWKGEGAATITVYTHPQNSACGFRFTVGNDYLVYAYEHTVLSLSEPNILMTNICTRTVSDSTALDSQAVADRQVFGLGKKPK